MVTKRSLELFQRAARDVPAYADFLKAHGLDPSTIKDVHDFKKVPATSKKNYLEQYSLPELLWDGSMDKPLIFCSTSGSTGVPYYFPRNDRLSWQYSWLIEDYLKRGQRDNKKPVLIIIGFGMGVWIGGIITMRAIEIAINRMNFPASVLPVGYNKTEIIKALERLSPQFGQTVIIGYPPFVKEVVDAAASRQIDLKKFNTRLMFAAESFTETFRNYLCRKTGANPLLDTLNIYGTADIGAMAYETPASILIRRLAVKNKKLFQNIFGQIDKTPTLAQFNPRYIEFEERDGEVLLTGNSAMPLIRYAIGDHGGVLGYKAMRRAFSESELDLDKEIAKAGITLSGARTPFVFVYERANFAVSLHGMIIYPQFIKEALLNPELSALVSGKFTMVTRYDRNQNQYLEVNIELQEDVKSDARLKTKAKKTIKQELIKLSSEFAEVAKNAPKADLIKVVFWPQGDPQYFSPGLKQKWSVQDK